MVEIFACEECGQVYYIKPPKKCMKRECNSIKFERIEEKDVINMHDVPQLIWNIFLKKLKEFTIKTF